MYGKATIEMARANNLKCIGDLNSLLAHPHYLICLCLDLYVQENSKSCVECIMSRLDPAVEPLTLKKVQLSKNNK